MNLIDDSIFLAMDPTNKSKFLIRFLYGLTLAFRDLQTGQGSDVQRGLIGLNQVNHYVLSYVDDNISGRIGKFPAHELIGYISDIGDGYDVKHQISIAWMQARSSEY